MFPCADRFCQPSIEQESAQNTRVLHTKLFCRLVALRRKGPDSPVHCSQPKVATPLRKSGSCSCTRVCAGGLHGLRHCGAPGGKDLFHPPLVKLITSVLLRRGWVGGFNKSIWTACPRSELRLGDRFTHITKHEGKQTLSVKGLCTARSLNSIHPRANTPPPIPRTRSISDNSPLQCGFCGHKACVRETCLSRGGRFFRSGALTERLKLQLPSAKGKRQPAKTDPGAHPHKRQ